MTSGKNILLVALTALALGLASVGGAALDLAGGKPGLSGGSGARIVTAGARPVITPANGAQAGPRQRSQAASLAIRAAQVVPRWLREA